MLEVFQDSMIFRCCFAQNCHVNRSVQTHVQRNSVEEGLSKKLAEEEEEFTVALDFPRLVSYFVRELFGVGNGKEAERLR